MTESEAAAGGAFDTADDPFGAPDCPAEAKERLRQRERWLKHSRRRHEAAREELRERPGLDLAPVSEVLRARWRETFRRELLALTAVNVSEAMAADLARAQADALIPQLVRRLAAEVWCGSLSGFVIENGVRLDISIKGDRYRMVMPGTLRAVEPVRDAALFDALDTARTFGPAVLAETVLAQPKTADGRPMRNAFLGGFSDELHIFADWPGSTNIPPRRAWPWGEYSTPDLELAAEAVREFWCGWKGDVANAPKNDSVIAWLEARGMSTNKAQAVAALIRSPKVPHGARPRRDE